MHPVLKWASKTKVVENFSYLIIILEPFDHLYFYNDFSFCKKPGVIRLLSVHPVNLTSFIRRREGGGVILDDFLRRSA